MTDAPKPKRTAEEKAERQRKHRKLFSDYADGLPKPGPDGIVPIPPRDPWGKR